MMLYGSIIHTMSQGELNLARELYEAGRAAHWSLEWEQLSERQRGYWDHLARTAVLALLREKARRTQEASTGW